MPRLMAQMMIYALIMIGAFVMIHEPLCGSSAHHFEPPLSPYIKSEINRFQIFDLNHRFRRLSGAEILKQSQ